MPTEVILLERVDNLGQMGETVKVKPGYARNFLLPQKKALRASKENVAYFEAKKKFLETESDKKKQEAERIAKKMDALKVPLIRQASESGQLYGSVTSRDIAVEVTATSKQEITRQMVQVNQNYKTLGLFPVDVLLHPEVKVTVIVNIARTLDEAEIQAKTGKALVSDNSDDSDKPKQPKAAEVELDNSMLDDEALEAQKEKAAEEQAEAEEEAKKAAEKKPRKPKAKKAEAAEEADEADEGDDD